MKDSLPNCACLQYAAIYQLSYLSTYHSAIYQPCSVKDLKACCISIEKKKKKLSRSLNWSFDDNLVFNATKTKLMLTVAQMKACHKLGEIKNLTIKFVEKQLELVNKWKLLGVLIDQHEAWKLQY